MQLPFPDGMFDAVVCQFGVMFYRQDYVLFLRAAGGRIVFLREYFDPVRAAKALDAPILDLDA